MSYAYFDDSKHHPWGFSLGALVFCDNDPTQAIARIIRRNGSDPDKFEFKSSRPMAGNSSLQIMRSELNKFIQSSCRIAICVVFGDKNIGPVGLRLLGRAISHRTLVGQEHVVHFDQGLFSSIKAASRLASETDGLESSTLLFEQNSKKVLGIQLADLCAHTCSTILLSALGKEMKAINVEDSGYDDDTEIPLDFELWAGIRYALLHSPIADPQDLVDHALVDLTPHGLLVDESVSERVALAATELFTTIYLGCIH